MNITFHSKKPPSFPKNHRVSPKPSCYPKTIEFSIEKFCFDSKMAYKKIGVNYYFFMTSLMTSAMNLKHNLLSFLENTAPVNGNSKGV